MRFIARYSFPFLLLIVLSVSCTSTKNTRTTRWYHAFNTRYNVYFNGNEAFKEALKAQEEGLQESYSEMILMYPVSSLPKDKAQPGGSFDRSIEKSVKAIKRHSIQTKPEKKAGKSRDPKYQEFMSRTEYNPFLHNAWMLMARSQFHNGDFLQAASSFSYISRLFGSQPEISLKAKIWQARCYAELGWHYEADDILSKLNNDQLPKQLTDWFSSVYADHLIKQKMYRESVPYLQASIKAEKNKLQRTRQKYLLGQIYTQLGQNDLAYKTFGEVSSANAPYILEFSAKIRQTEVYPGRDTTKIIGRLRKMAKSSKNKNYLDQVYYAMGNIYMAIPDTAKAIVSYEKGVEGSVTNGTDKALNQIRLGDIYFQQRRYLNSHPNYAGALPMLKKEDEAYPRVSKRAEVLGELVVHIEAVELQDSLQRLSRMSEEERLVVVNKIIEELIRKEKEEAENAAREEYLSEEAARRDENQAFQPTKTVQPPQSQEEAGSFYFYNSQVVSIGKNTFQQKWGRRKLEDDWRRRDKAAPLGEFSEEEEIAEEVTDQPEESPGETDAEASSEPEVAPETSTDPKDPQFYLQQIPVTEEDIEASNLIIADALYNMGVIYKEKLEDYYYALETFDILDARFPANENKLDAYYHVFQIYWKLGNQAMADLYKSKIRAEFPTSHHAIAMEDPNYEYNLKMTQVIQDSLYRSTYEAYLEGNIREIRDNYELASKKYNQSKLMPKFLFLNAMTYAQTNDPEKFKTLLKELIEKYPGTDVTELATEMMKGFQRGLLLSTSGDVMLARGGLFNIRMGGTDDLQVADSLLTFSNEKNGPFELLLVYSTKEVDENFLLFTVADFNFGNFMVNDFGLDKTRVGEAGILQIKGFNNFDEVLQYLSMIEQPNVYGHEMDELLVKVPISVDNYGTLMRGKSLDQYLLFFEENFAEGNENLIARWNLKREKELESLLEEEAEEQTGDEEELEVVIDPVKEPDTPESETSVDRDGEEEAVQEPDSLPGSPVHLPDSLSVSSQSLPDSLQTSIAIPEAEAGESTEEESQSIDEGELLREGTEQFDKMNQTISDFAEDPIRGIQNLFKRRKPNALDEYVKQQEKEEKEKKKQLERERKEKEKAKLELERQQQKEQEEIRKQQEKEDKALLKAKQQQERDLAKLKEEERKQAEKEKKRLAKEKEDTRKAELKKKEEDRKAREKQRETERKEKEKARKEAQKLKDQERKERDKAREAERKAKDKLREEERKQKEKERKRR